MEVCGEKANVFFQERQRAVAPGQSLVIYRGEEVLGGGVIEGRFFMKEGERNY
jgi:tRNA-specific 2-thiouridylase